MKGKRVKAVGGHHDGRTGVVVGSIGMCYDVKMDDTGEVLSGGKPRWRVLPAKKSKDGKGEQR